MNKGPIAVTVSLMLSVLLVLPPIAISAGRGGGGGHSGGGGHGGGMGHGSFGGGRGGFGGSHGFVGGHGFGSHSSFNRGSFHHRPFFNRGFGRFFPFGAFASPVFFGSYGWPYGSYGWPYYYGSALYSDPSPYYNGGPGSYGPPVGYSPAMAPASAAPPVYSININNPAPAAVQPAVYEPAAIPAAPAAAPSPQGVVEYEGGRYELRGDGMTVAYRWVWIPSPPSGPPGSTAMGAPTSGDLAPARRGTIYRWVDDQGVLHVTDRWQTVPQRYRDQAKKNLAS
jgi:hypothetical protein